MRGLVVKVRRSALFFAEPSLRFLGALAGAEGRPIFDLRTLGASRSGKTIPARGCGSALPALSRLPLAAGDRTCCGPARQSARPGLFKVAALIRWLDFDEIGAVF